MLRTISLDFDGVLCDTQSWTSPEIIDGLPTPYAVDAVKILARDYNVVVSSSRAATNEGQRAIHKWLKQHGFEGFEKVTGAKVPSLLHVDDRCMRFTGDWDDVLWAAEDKGELVPWNKRRT